VKGSREACQGLRPHAASSSRHKSGITAKIPLQNKDNLHTPNQIAARDECSTSLVRTTRCSSAVTRRESGDAESNNKTIVFERGRVFEVNHI
jgi:hypothetical protein